MNKFLWEKPPTSPLCISRKECHVWKVDLGTVNKENYQIGILSEDEQKRLSSFKFAKDRFRYGITHSMKRRILASYLNEQPEKLVFTREQYGKPAILAQQNWLNLQFNLSHSNQLILLGITIDDPIGIDVEYHTDRIDLIYTESLPNLIFSPKEKDYFYALTSKQEKINYFFRVWTQKEAYLKAKGLGLKADPTSISIETNGQSLCKWLKILTSAEQETSIWNLFSFPITEFYSASLVIANDEKTFCTYELKMYE